LRVIGIDDSIKIDNKKHALIFLSMIPPLNL